MRSVLDTSLFFLQYPVSGEIYTTPSVVDELVETLQSVTPLFRRSGGSNGSLINKELWQTLRALREKEFEQRTKEIAAGRQPTLRDFVCGADVLLLVQAKPPDNQRSREVARYLAAMCQKTGGPGSCLLWKKLSRSSRSTPAAPDSPESW
jgi:hypothetical protein